MLPFIKKKKKKMSNPVGRKDNFLAKARKLLILPTSLDIFDIRQRYIRILFISEVLFYFFKFRKFYRSRIRLKIFLIPVNMTSNVTTLHKST